MSERSTAPSRIGSILFTDLVGFTEFTEARGDPAAFAVLDQQRALAGATLDGVDARVVKELGDGLMIWFAHACDGVECAARLLQSIASGHETGTFPLAVRMGMHHGTAMARGDDLIGTTVNIAARVADLAAPGELLLSEAVLGACAPAGQPRRLHAVGPARVKGVQEPVWLYRLAV
jgi:class 3 adenylate cyclase